jgi:hypothetical protein
MHEYIPACGARLPFEGVNPQRYGIRRLTINRTLIERSVSSFQRYPRASIMTTLNLRRFLVVSLSSGHESAVLCSATSILRRVLHLFCCLSDWLQYVRSPSSHPSSPHISLPCNVSYKVACFCNNDQFSTAAEACIQQNCAGSDLQDARGFIEDLCTVSSVGASTCK